MINNLKEFPTINCLTLEKSKLRQKSIINQCEKYNLDFKFHYGIDGLNKSLVDFDIRTPFLNQMNLGEVFCSLSHIIAISNWLNNTDDDFGFFCEDDIDFTSSDNWRFTWKEFISKLPEDWGIIQLVLVRDFGNCDINEYMKLHKYVWDNWSTCSYIISRKYAKNLINDHIKEYYDFNLPYFPNTVPYAENIIYNNDNKESAYTIPLFLENLKLDSNFYPIFIKTESKNTNKISFDVVNNWWKEKGVNKDIDWFFQ